MSLHYNTFDKKQSCSNESSRGYATLQWLENESSRCYAMAKSAHLATTVLKAISFCQLLHKVTLPGSNCWNVVVNTISYYEKKKEKYQIKQRYKKKDKQEKWHHQ